jgi:hypothetical protein
LQRKKVVMVMLNYLVFLPKDCLVSYFFAQLLENKFKRNSPIHRGVTTYVLQTKTMNVLLLLLLLLLFIY